MIENVSFMAALTAGLLSFFSPCILPLVPSYFTFITGLSLDELTDSPTVLIQRRVVISTLSFVLGFSVVFVAMGATASFLSSVLMGYKAYLRMAGGALIILLGLHVAGLLRISALDFEKRIHLQRKPLHMLGAFVIGAAFGAGWSPCIGPMLGSILILAGNQESVSRGIWLLSLYSAGLAVPFIILSFFINTLIGFVRRTTRAMVFINRIAGTLLIITGMLLVTDKLRLLSYF